MTEPASNRPLRVFLCHASDDKPKVRELYKRFIADGIDVWFDEEKLLPGQDWRLEIPKAVETSDVVLVCLSNTFVKKEGYGQKEIVLALDAADQKPEGTIFVIPARLEECEVPRRLSRWQWVDLFAPHGYEKLRLALQTRAQQVQAASPVKNAKPITQAMQKYWWLIPVLLTIAIGTIVYRSWSQPAPPSDGVTQTITLTQTFPPEPSTISIPTITPTITPTATVTLEPTTSPTITPLPSQISDTAGVPMALIPAGTFEMGSDRGLSSERPAHSVFLKDFYIDLFEVTNAHYRTCVEAGSCLEPVELRSKTHGTYFQSSSFDNYPVVYVTWQMAQDYCAWREARLPTEAEWEKAARGTDGRTFPWGEGSYCTIANYCMGDTVAVGRYENGKSFYGLYDMAGNVVEWVTDWYDKTYYSASPVENPVGPLSGGQRVARGGSFEDHSYTDLQSYHRVSFPPQTATFYLGVRCARDGP